MTALVVAWVAGAVAAAPSFGRAIAEEVPPPRTNVDMVGIGTLTILFAAVWPILGLAWAVGAAIDRSRR